MSGYASFLSWWYKSKQEDLKGPARQWPHSAADIKTLGPKMITVSQKELTERISTLKHVETQKRIKFAPMNDMIAELHSVFERKKMGRYSIIEEFLE